MSDKLIYKKYSNRRLYNTEKSTYVTLGQVAAEIKAGRLVQVVDAKTKEDVTAFILTQIILEEAKENNFLLPVPVLHLIIQYGDNMLGEFFEKHLQQTIQNYLQFKNVFDSQVKRWLDLGIDLSANIPKSVAQTSPLKAFMDIFPLNEKGVPVDPQQQEQDADEGTDKKKNQE